MSGEKGSFRGKLFGGFNRQDVIDYIEKTAAEHNACESERDSLRQENEKLRAENDELNAVMDILKKDSDRTAESLRQENERLTQELESEREHTLSVRTAELGEAEKAVEALLAECRRLKADMAVNINNARCEVKKIDTGLDGFTGIADDLEKRLIALRDEISGMKEGK